MSTQHLCLRESQYKVSVFDCGIFLASSDQPLKTSSPKGDFLFRTLLVPIIPELASIEIKNEFFSVASQWQFILFVWRICCLLQDELRKIYLSMLVRSNFSVLGLASAND